MKHNRFKRTLAGVLAVLTVAAPAATNVGGILKEFSIVASAANEKAGVLGISNVKAYIKEVKINNESYTTLGSINKFDVPANATVTVTATARLAYGSDDDIEMSDGQEGGDPQQVAQNDALDEKFDGKNWVYTFKQTVEGDKELAFKAGSTEITFAKEQDASDSEIAKKITSWKIGNGGDGKEYTRTATDAGEAKPITGAKLGEQIEITSTELLDFSDNTVLGLPEAGKNVKPVRTVKSSGTTVTYTYTFSASATTISKGTHQHEFEVVGLTADKSALELKCSDIVDGKHSAPYSVYLTMFNLTKVASTADHKKGYYVDNPKADDHNVILSELLDKNFIFGNFDDNTAWGLYDNAQDAAFWSAGGFVDLTDDNVSSNGQKFTLAFAAGDKEYVIPTKPVIYDAETNKVVLEVGKNDVTLVNFDAKLNELTVGSYIAKYSIVNNNGGEDIIDEGTGNVTIGTGDTSNTNVYTIEVPFNVLQAEVTDDTFFISNNSANLVDGVYNFAYSENERYTPIVSQTVGLTEGKDYKLEGDLSASRVGKYSIYVIGLGNYDFEYELKWAITETDVSDEAFTVQASSAVYGESVYNAVKDKLSFKSEKKVYSYFYKPKDQTDDVTHTNTQALNTKAAWVSDLKSKGYTEITPTTVLSAGDYTITVIAEDVNEKNADGSAKATRSYTDNFLTVAKVGVGLSIEGTIVTFDGESHVANAADATVRCRVGTLGTDSDGDVGITSSAYTFDWVNENVYDDIYAAVNALGVEIDVAAEYANLKTDEEKAKAADIASVTHAGKYKLRIKKADLEKLIKRFGENYEFVMNYRMLALNEKGELVLPQGTAPVGYSEVSASDVAQYKLYQRVEAFYSAAGMSVSYGYGMGFASGSLVIMPAEFTVTLKKESYVYSGRLIEPEFTVTGVKGTVLKEGTDFTIDGGTSAKGLETEDTQYYAIVEGAGDYVGAKDAFNWRIVNNSALRNSATVTYGDTSSILKEGKQRVTYQIKRELLPTAPAGTKITAAGVYYYNGKGAAAITSKETLLNKVGTWIDPTDKVNVVKRARQANPSTQNGTMTVNVLDNGYGTALLGFIEVTDKDGNSTTILANEVKIATYAAANVEAEKAAQAAISVSYKNDPSYVKYKVNKDGKDQVSFQFTRSLDPKATVADTAGKLSKALEEYDYLVTEYGCYYYNGLNDINESALTNQWVGKAPTGVAVNSDTTNVVKQAHVIVKADAESQAKAKNGTLTVNIADNGNGVKARGFMCVAIYKKGDLEKDGAKPIYETTVYSANAKPESTRAKIFDAEHELEVYDLSVTTLSYDALVKAAIGIDGTNEANPTIAITNQSSEKKDNGQTVSVTVKDETNATGNFKEFTIVGYGAVYTTNENATVADLTLDKVGGSTKNVYIEKDLANNTSASAIVEGSANKKYQTYVVAKDADGNHTVIYAGTAGVFVE
jgi:hypothetical protein